MRDTLVAYAQGFAMGAADVVPGVSGATIALILGIYDRLIRAITRIDPRAFTSVLRVHRSDERAKLFAELERTDALFLLSLGTGIATAIVILSRVLHVAVTAYPVPTYAFFAGLIGASAVILYAEIDVWTGRRIGVAATGIVVAALVTRRTTADVPHGPSMIFVAGAIAICAMVLPGVSGAFFLLILGQYEYLTGTLTAFIDGLFGLLRGGPLGPVVDAGSVVAVFGFGAILGLFAMSHAVRRALERYRSATLAFLVSLMVGALRLPFETVVDGLGESAGGTLPIAALAAVVGCGIVVLVERYTSGLDYETDRA